MEKRKKKRATKGRSAQCAPSAAGFLCFYCKKGQVPSLPMLCPGCGKYLSAKVVPDMEVNKLAELAFRNGVRLDVRMIPIEKFRTKTK